jgi:hypothetical protein
MHTKIWTENLKEREHWESLCGDFEEIIWEGLDWHCLAQDVEPWWACVNTGLNLYMPYCCTAVVTIILSGRSLHHDRNAL